MNDLAVEVNMFSALTLYSIFSGDILHDPVRRNPEELRHLLRGAAEALLLERLADVTHDHVTEPCTQHFL